MNTVNTACIHAHTSMRKHTHAHTYTQELTKAIETMETPPIVTMHTYIFTHDICAFTLTYTHAHARTRGEEGPRKNGCLTNRDQMQMYIFTHDICALTLTYIRAHTHIGGEESPRKNGCLANCDHAYPLA